MRAHTLNYYVTIMEPKFKIAEVFATSWKCLKSQIWVLVGLLIGMSILSLTLSVFAMPMQESWMGKAIITLINIFFLLLFTLGYTKNIFQALDGDEPQFSAYGQQVRKLFTSFLSSILCFIIVFVGLSLFIIPGIYLMLRLQFYICFIVEEDAGVIDSLTRSWEITKGSTLKLLWLGFVMIGITVLGFALIVVGLFVASPLIIMMQCCVYRRLSMCPSTTVEVNN